jgi:hypothetical protein
LYTLELLNSTIVLLYFKKDYYNNYDPAESP